MEFLIVTLLYLVALVVASPTSLAPSATPSSCPNLHALSNNGDRKIAIVIDTSGSMVDSDPDNLRLTAGKQIVDWLISDNEATGSKKADQVTVINFDDSAHLDYPLGDPGNASSSFDGMGADGGTFIAGGVEMAIDQLTQQGSGSTAKRSGIFVFTDGEDSDTAELVAAINNATDLGIRVSFGFLNPSLESGSQDPSIQRAILNSGGYFSVITDASSAIAFIDVAIANGLTYNDNPQGYNGTLFAGLSTSRLLKAGQSSLVVYDARDGEELDWTISTYNISQLNVVATLNGKTVETTSVASDAFNDDIGSGEFNVSAVNAGQVQIKIHTGSLLNGESDGMIVVSVDSNLPFDNCTLTIGKLPDINGGGGGLSKGGKAGIAVGVIALVTGVAGGVYFLTKYWPKSPVPNTVPQTPHPPPMEKAPFVSVNEPIQPTYFIPPAVPPIPPLSQAPPPTQPNQPDQHPHDQHDASASDMSGSDNGSDLERDSSQQNPNNHHKIKVKRIKRRKRDILEGKLLTSDGLVVDDSDPKNLKPLGRLVSGDITTLVGKRCAKKGQILDDEGTVIGQCEVLPKGGKDEEDSAGEGGADPEKRKSKKNKEGDTEEYESWGKTIAREGVKTGVQEAVKAAVSKTGLTDRIEDAVNAVL